MGCSLLNNYNQHNDVVIPQLGPHWPLISCVLSSLGRLGPARAEVGLSFAVVGWFRRFCLPPLRWFCSVSVGLRFSFLLPFQGLPAPGQVCWCWCFLLTSSFAFSSSCPGQVFSISSSCSSHSHSLCILTFTSFVKTSPCLEQGVCACACLCETFAQT